LPNRATLIPFTPKSTSVSNLSIIRWPEDSVSKIENRKNRRPDHGLPSVSLLRFHQPDLLRCDLPEAAGTNSNRLFTQLARDDLVMLAVRKNQ
jgi:hypothetical protein